MTHVATKPESDLTTDNGLQRYFCTSNLQQTKINGQILEEDNEIAFLNIFTDECYVNLINPWNYLNKKSPAQFIMPISDELITFNAIFYTKIDTETMNRIFPNFETKDNFEYEDSIIADMILSFDDINTRMQSGKPIELPEDSLRKADEIINFLNNCNRDTD